MSHLQPGLRAASAEPLAYSPTGHPIYLAQGGRGGGGIQFAVGTDDGPDPDFGDEDGDPDDDDDDEDDGPDEDEDPRDRRSTGRQQRRRDDTGADDGDSWTPPDKAAWDNMESALRRANGEAAKRRRAAKLLDRLGVDSPEALEARLNEWGIDPATGQRGDTGPDSDDDGAPEADDAKPQTRDPRYRFTDDDVKREATRATERTRVKYEATVKLLGAEAAIRAADWQGKNLDMALRFIDPNAIEVEVDDEGNVYLDGLDEQIEDMKQEFPDWFKPKETPQRRRTQQRGTRGARDVDGGDRGRPPARPKGWLETALSQLDGR